MVLKIMGSGFERKGTMSTKRVRNWALAPATTWSRWCRTPTSPRLPAERKPIGQRTFFSGSTDRRPAQPAAKPGPSSGTCSAGNRRLPDPAQVRGMMPIFEMRWRGLAVRPGTASTLLGPTAAPAKFAGRLVIQTSQMSTGERKSRAAPRRPVARREKGSPKVCAARCIKTGSPSDTKATGCCGRAVKQGLRTA